MRRLCLQYRLPEADRPPDPCVPILARSHHIQSQELGIDRQQVEAFGPLVSQTLSSSSSIHQNIGIGHQGDGSFLQALIPHTSRISDLSLTGYPSIESAVRDPSLSRFFASPIPLLTSLELEQSDQSGELFPSNEASALSLFRSVSKVKSLRLIQTPLYPTVFSITSLVELKLVGYTAPFDFGKFIGFLHSNLNFKFVTLDLQFAEESVEIAPKRKASLPQLRHLTFTCWQ